MRGSDQRDMYSVLPVLIVLNSQIAATSAKKPKKAAPPSHIVDPSLTGQHFGVFLQGPRFAGFAMRASIRAAISSIVQSVVETPGAITGVTLSVL